MEIYIIIYEMLSFNDR